MQRLLPTGILWGFGRSAVAESRVQALAVAEHLDAVGDGVPAEALEDLRGGLVVADPGPPRRCCDLRRAGRVPQAVKSRPIGSGVITGSAAKTRT